MEQGVVLFRSPHASRFDHQFSAWVELFGQLDSQQHASVKIDLVAALQHRAMRGDIDQIAYELITVAIKNSQVAIDDLALFTSCFCHGVTPLTYTFLVLLTHCRHAGRRPAACAC